MKTNKLKSLIAFALIGVMGISVVHAHSWGYNEHITPDKWGEIEGSAACALGKNQTPINIESAYQAKLPALNINYIKSTASIVNNGHTIQVDVNDANNFLIFKDNKYTLKQFHFHVPSENHIDGQSFSMEAHFVHMNEENEYLVLAVMYNIGDENRLLSTLLTQLGKVEGESKKLSSRFDIEELLPKNYAYYHFSGSLTTPPCSEGVTWVVLKSPLTISIKQEKIMLKEFKGHNNRPLQSLNGRTIISN